MKASQLRLVLDMAHLATAGVTPAGLACQSEVGFVQCDAAGLANSMPDVCMLYCSEGYTGCVPLPMTQVGNDRLQVLAADSSEVWSHQQLEKD